MITLECDVAIIGAGTAGLAAERSARATGAKTLLIDDRFAGTTCATVGCMPSKLLIAAAHAAHSVRTASVFGIGAEEPRIDGKAVLARVRRERDAFVSGTLKSIDNIPEGIRQTARASFLDATTLLLDDGRRVSAKAVVIATGSRPHIPPLFEALGDRILTNETIFELDDLPQSIAVVGAGPLGLELAQALRRLGVETQVFNEGDHLAGLKDDAVAAELHKILQAELPIHLGVKLTVAREGQAARVTWTGASSGSDSFDYVLVATGRPPQLKGLGLHKTGIDLDEHGTPTFDRSTLQCGDSAIFIAGDADHDRPLLHEASSQGAIAGRNAASFPDVESFPRDPAFSIMFTDPPLAVIGAPADKDSVVGSASYADQGRAKVEARNVGLVRLYAARPDGRLTGAVMAGPGMDHIGHLLAWAIKRGEIATGLLAMPFYHPTFEEGLKAALRSICNEIHAPLPRDRDEGSSPGS
jgi:dihydrolipoamide dehydrogenase